MGSLSAKEGRENDEQKAKQRRRIVGLRTHVIRDREEVSAYLVKTPMRGSESMNEFMVLFSNQSDSFHWKLYFKFEELHVTLDGLMEYEQLVPRFECSYEPPEGEHFPLDDTTVKSNYTTAGFNSLEVPSLANLTVSPNDLRLVAMATGGDANYRLFQRDCQTWAVKAANLIKKKFLDPNYVFEAKGNNSFLSSYGTKEKADGSYGKNITLEAFIPPLRSKWLENSEVKEYELLNL